MVKKSKKKIYPISLKDSIILLNKQGVGIGLALSKEIIEKHHGLVIAYNDNGVVFEITFPLFQMNDKYKVS